MIYEIAEDAGDFFRSTSRRLSYYADDARELPASFFQSELEWFKNRNDPQQRGRDFDILMGLLFQQLDGVKVRLKGSTDTGEVDVYLDCLEAPNRICRLMGSHTIVENKWQKNSVQTKEISGFREKTTDIGACKAAYFISMSGFSRGTGKDIGALAQLRQYENPRMIDLWQDDVEDMIRRGNPEETLRSRMMK